MMVPRIQIHLSPPGIKYLLLGQWGLLLVTVGALTVTGMFWWAGTNLHEKIDRIAEQVTTLTFANEQFVAQAGREDLDLSPSAMAGIPKQITFVKQLRERVGFSWTQLLADLEAAVPAKISMDAISLEDKTNTILMQGSAQSLEDLNRLIHQLENHKAFQQVILGQHATKTQNDLLNGSYVVFSMKATYRPQQ
ncbi:MAG: PilN domain-containing protein [Nitrospirales bacterium]